MRETVACAETVAVDFQQRERPYWGCPWPNFVSRVEGKAFWPIFQPKKAASCLKSGLCLPGGPLSADLANAATQSFARRAKPCLLTFARGTSQRLFPQGVSLLLTNLR